VNRNIVVLGCLLIACAIYAPVGIYVFDNSLGEMFGRAYFMIGGAAIALYAPS